LDRWCPLNDRLHNPTPTPQRPNPPQEDKGHAIRYLSIDPSPAQYRQYYEGHTARVTSLDMSPKNDTFLSAGEVRAPVWWRGHCALLLLY